MVQLPAKDVRVDVGYEVDDVQRQPVIYIRTSKLERRGKWWGKEPHFIASNGPKNDKEGPPCLSLTHTEESHVMWSQTSFKVWGLGLTLASKICPPRPDCTFRRFSFVLPIDVEVGLRSLSRDVWRMPRWATQRLPEPKTWMFANVTTGRKGREGPSKGLADCWQSSWIIFFTYQQVPKMTTIETQSRLFFFRLSFSASSLAAFCLWPGLELIRLASRYMMTLQLPSGISVTDWHGLQPLEFESTWRGTEIPLLSLSMILFLLQKIQFQILLLFSLFSLSCNRKFDRGGADEKNGTTLMWGVTSDKMRAITKENKLFG